MSSAVYSPPRDNEQYSQCSRFTKPICPYVNWSRATRVSVYSITHVKIRSATLFTAVSINPDTASNGKEITECARIQFNTQLMTAVTTRADGFKVTQSSSVYEITKHHSVTGTPGRRRCLISDMRHWEELPSRFGSRKHDIRESGRILTLSPPRWGVIDLSCVVCVRARGGVRLSRELTDWVNVWEWPGSRPSQYV